MDILYVNAANSLRRHPSAATVNRSKRLDLYLSLLLGLELHMLHMLLCGFCMLLLSVIKSMQKVHQNISKSINQNGFHVPNSDVLRFLSNPCGTGLKGSPLVVARTWNPGIQTKQLDPTPKDGQIWPVFTSQDAPRQPPRHLRQSSAIGSTKHSTDNQSQLFPSRSAVSICFLSTPTLCHKHSNQPLKS